MPRTEGTRSLRTRSLNLKCRGVHRETPSKVTIEREKKPLHARRVTSNVAVIDPPECARRRPTPFHAGAARLAARPHIRGSLPNEANPRAR